jgi:hypothetical protein
MDCAICTDQAAPPVGRLPCDHGFCFPCVLEWSCIRNECPLCKSVFNNIRVQHADGSCTTERVETPVSPEDLERKALEEAKCLVCRKEEREHELLLCDGAGCTVSCHTYCCDPPLSAVPEGQWLCSKCCPRRRLRTRLRPVVVSSGESETDSNESDSSDSPSPRPARRELSLAQRERLNQNRLRALARRRTREFRRQAPVPSPPISTPTPSSTLTPTPTPLPLPLPQRAPPPPRRREVGVLTIPSPVAKRPRLALTPAAPPQSLSLPQAASAYLQQRADLGATVQELVDHCSSLTASQNLDLDQQVRSFLDQSARAMEVFRVGERWRLL